jgi:hypothetical protein
MNVGYITGFKYHHHEINSYLNAMSYSHAKTRQKSCISCANAKRRCDRQSPTCTQCASKSVRCQYKAAQPLSSIPRSGEESLTSSSGSDLLDGPAENGTENPHFHHSSPVFPYSPSSVPPLIAVDNLVQPIHSLLDVDETFLDIYDMQLFSNPPRIGTMERPRAAWLVKTLCSYPRLLLTKTKTPFIHPFLFSPTIPSPLQDAISGCSLYLAKNATNEGLVWEIISSMVAKLLQPRTSWAVSEHLSCVQALTIFQIIRLFDGDVRARGDAEEAERVLDEWTDHLALRTGAIADPLENVPVDAQHLLDKGWESWVFEESVRRTIIVGRMVSATYSVLKRGFCTFVEKVDRLSFTARKELWDANSPVGWRLAVETPERFYVTRMDLREVLEKARLDDVDDLGLLMLVTYKGLDGVNDWIVRMGSESLLD